LHQICHEQQVALVRPLQHLIRLFDRHGQRLLADNMLACVERGQRLFEMQERRRGDVDHVNVIALQQFFDALDFIDLKPPSCRQRGGPMRPGHPHQRDAGDLREMLQRKKPKSTAADHTESNIHIIHLGVTIKEVMERDCRASRR
jgi:hypothetical protein